FEMPVHEREPVKIGRCEPALPPTAMQGDAGLNSWCHVYLAHQPESHVAVLRLPVEIGMTVLVRIGDDESVMDDRLLGMCNQVAHGGVDIGTLREIVLHEGRIEIDAREEWMNQ